MCHPSQVMRTKLATFAWSRHGQWLSAQWRAGHAQEMPIIKRSDVQAVHPSGTLRGLARAIMDTVPIVTSVDVSESVGSATFVYTPPLEGPAKREGSSGGQRTQTRRSRAHRVMSRDMIHAKPQPVSESN